MVELTSSSKYVVYWNVKGELNYSLVSSNYHKGLRVVAYFSTMEDADNYVKRFNEYHQKLNKFNNDKATVRNNIKTDKSDNQKNLLFSTTIK